MNAKKSAPRRNTRGATGRIGAIGKRSWLRWAALVGLAAVGFFSTYGLVTLARNRVARADAAATATASLPPKSATEAPPLPPVKPEDPSLRINARTAPDPTPPGMIWVPGGIFWSGNDTPAHRDARPWHLVEVDGFWMDATTVTNEQFGVFVKATGYVTVAERTPKASDFPNAPPENLVAGSVIFTPPKGAVPLNDHFRWWSFAKGANWRHPEGPGSGLESRQKHPVVHVAYEDALAYCKWAGKRLPTEAEFEFASRGGLDHKKFAWGDHLKLEGKWMANIWQGRFPYENTAEDGFRATAPVGSFPPNGFGLSDMAGNVWQWCADWYRHDYYTTLATASGPAKNPQGPPDSLDPSEPGVAKRVMRGGSYLCTDQYCTAYEAGARGKGAPDTGTNHLGFRCVKSAK